MTAPFPSAGYITTCARYPQIEPLWPKLNAWSLPSRTSPNPYGGFCTVSISVAIFLDKSLVERPRHALEISSAHLASSVGVVHRPQAAISGCTGHLPVTTTPSPSCPLAASLRRGSGSGCSYVLRVIPRGSNNIRFISE